MSFIADTRDLERAQKILAGIPNGTQKAISSAINASAGKAVTGVIQSLKKIILSVLKIFEKVLLI